MPIIFKKLETFIYTTLNPFGASEPLFSDEIIESFISQFELEKENVRYLLIEEVIDRQKVMDKQQYVQVVQGMLIRLLDKLHSYKKNKGLEHKLLSLYNTISEHLGEILSFIEDFFSNYFDRNKKVPISYLLISIEELSRQLLQLQEILELNEELDKVLKNILVYNFNSFFSIKSAAPTYNELLYQKDLMSELMTYNACQTENSISEVLFYFNFNNDDFVSYLFQKLKDLTENVDTNKEKIVALRYEQKIINQFTTKLNSAFSHNMPSLKEQVNSWIEEEIKFLLTDVSLVTVKITENEVGDKIQTSLSVSKLALLIRLMVIDKVITNQVVTVLLRIVVRTVSTLHAENIAFGSLETKYHNPDKGTISAVKDMLFRWMNILSKL
jgi:dsDNA-binding SOS-regulon protein